MERIKSLLALSISRSCGLETERSMVRGLLEPPSYLVYVIFCYHPRECLYGSATGASLVSSQIPI